MAFVDCGIRNCYYNPIMATNRLNATIMIIGNMDSADGAGCQIMPSFDCTIVDITKLIGADETAG